MNNIVTIILISGILISLTTEQAYSYKVATHELITQGVFNKSKKLNEFVTKNELDLDAAQTTVIHGSAWEDNILTVTINTNNLIELALCHFYNPVNGHGYDDPGTNNELWESSIARATNPENEWSYQHAKDYLYAALSGNSSTIGEIYIRNNEEAVDLYADDPDSTLAPQKAKLTHEERELFFDYTFQAIGHNVHLIEDSSVPLHSRNDVHHYFQPYEYWLEHSGLGLYDSIDGWQNLYDYPGVAIPNVFHDVGKATGANYDSYDSFDQGLAEYSHSNFFSSNSIDNFDMPRIPLGTRPDSEDLYIETKKTGDMYRVFAYVKNKNIEINHFAICGYLYFYDGIHTNFCGAQVVSVDDPAVHQDYATKLLKRAAAYSLAFIDYFFRGQLYVANTVSLQGARYIRPDGEVSFTEDIEKLTADIVNISNPSDTGYEPIGEGALVGSMRYMDRDNNYQYSSSTEIPLTPELTTALNSGSPQSIEFDFSNDKIPHGMKDYTLQVVFKGTLGNEIDTAIASGREEEIVEGLEITRPDEYTYSIVDGSNADSRPEGSQSTEPFADTFHENLTLLKAKIRNTLTRVDENGNSVKVELTNGNIYAIASYRIVPDPLTHYTWDQTWFTTLMETQEFAASISTEIAIDQNSSSLSSTEAKTFTFDFSASPIPSAITDLKLAVYYHGETDDPNKPFAVLTMGIKDLNEPQHLTYWNDTDYFLFNGAAVTADDFRADLDSTQYGYIYPYGYIDPHNISTKLSLSDSYSTATSDPLVEIIDQQPARYARLILLTDNPGGYYVTDQTTCHWIDYPYWPEYTWRYTLSAYVVQEYQNAEGESSWTWTSMYTGRGIMQHQRVYYINSYPDFPGINSLPAPSENDLGPQPVIINF